MHAVIQVGLLKDGLCSVQDNSAGLVVSVVGFEVAGILMNLSLDEESRSNLMQPAKVSLVVDMSNEGSVETKINCTRLIENLMEGDDFESQVLSSFSLLVRLLRLVKDRRHLNGVLSGLTLLKAVSALESVRCSMLSIGAVPQLVELLPSLPPESLELALAILVNLSSLREDS